MSMKPMSDYSFIRGIHLSNMPPIRPQNRPNFGAGPGARRREVIPLDLQLDYCEKLNINSHRQFGDYTIYYADPEACIGFYRDTIRKCWSRGVSTMQILFSGNSLDPAILEPSWWEEKGDDYVRAMVTALKDEPGLLMWDIMNEPSCNNWMRDSGENRPIYWEKINAFLEHYCKLVKELDPEGCITIGHTVPADIEPSAAWVDVISFHDYTETRARINNAYQTALAYGEKYGIPVINSEMCCLCRANPYDVAIEIAMNYNVGFYVFNLISEGYWGEVHGLIYPDGTVRDPAGVAAMYGFFRNRGPNRIKAKPNREGFVYTALKFLEESLTDTTGLFNNIPRTADEVLEAAEFAANLMEANEMVPMINPPSAQILDWRAMPLEEREKHIEEIRAFAYNLGKILKEYCQVL